MPSDPGTPSWFDLMTPDPDAAGAFYAQVFGWDYTPDSGPEMGHYRMALAQGKLAAGMGKAQGEMPSVWSVYFDSPDVDAFQEQVEAGGGATVAPPMDVGDSGRMAIFADPTGAVFGVWQAGQHDGAQIKGEHGSMCWCEVNTWKAPEAVAFYEGVLGAKGEKLEDRDYWTLTVSGERPDAGVLQMTAEWEGMQPHWMVYFAVDDVAAAVTTIDEAGGRVMHGPFDTPYGRMAVAMDPFGAAFTVIQLPASE